MRLRSVPAYCHDARARPAAVVGALCAGGRNWKRCADSCTAGIGFREPSAIRRRVAPRHGGASTPTLAERRAAFAPENHRRWFAVAVNLRVVPRWGQCRARGNTSSNELRARSAFPPTVRAMRRSAIPRAN